MDQDDKEQEGIVSTVTNTVFDTAQAGLNVAGSGLEGAKDAVQAAGSAATEYVTSSVAKVVRKPRKAAVGSRGKPKRLVKPAPKPKPATKRSGRNSAAKKSVAKSSARKPVRKSSSIGRSKTRRSSRGR